MMTMILIVVFVVTVGGEEMVMVKTMVKRRGPHKLSWKSFFHDYDDDDSGVGDDGDDDD